MALPTSGALSINDIHIEAGGASGTLASLNDADIRTLIGVASGASTSIAAFYGASGNTSIEIRAWGARGGTMNDYNGTNLYGRGRRCTWIGAVPSGTVVYLAVGGRGNNAWNPYGAGGGAGTMAYVGNNWTKPLIISGGGGAGSYYVGSFVGYGGYAPSGPGHGGDASTTAGYRPTTDAQGGRSNGSGGAGSIGRSNGANGRPWSAGGYGGTGGDGGSVTLGGDAGLSNILRGGRGSSRAGDGGGGGGGGGYGGGGGGCGWAYVTPAAAGSSQVFSQAAYGAVYASTSGNGGLNTSGGLCQIYIGGALVKQTNVGQTTAGQTSNYTVS